MKKIFLLLPLVFLSLTGCANKSSSGDNTTSDATTSQQETSKVESESESKTESESTSEKVETETQGSQTSSETTPNGEDTSTETETEPIELGICDPVDNKQFYFGFERQTGGTLPGNETHDPKDVLPGKYYLNGKMAGFYFDTTMEVSEAIGVTTVKSGSKWNLKVTAPNNENNGKYIGAAVSGTHLNIVYASTAYDWSYDDTNNTFIGSLDGKTVALGTNKEELYTTMSVFDSGKYPLNTNYLAHLYGEGGQPDNPVEPDPQDPDTPIEGNIVPVENKEFYFGFNRENDFQNKPSNGKPGGTVKAGNYYITGSMAQTYYFEITSEISGAATIKTIKSGNDWNLKVTNGKENVGKYIATSMSSDNKHVNIIYSSTPFAWAYDANLNTFQGKLDGKTIGLGTVKDKGFETMSAYNVDEKGVNNTYLAKLYAKDGNQNPEPDKPVPTPNTHEIKDPSQNGEFLFGFERDQDFNLKPNKGKPAKTVLAGKYFIDGTIANNYYLGTTMNDSEAMRIITIKSDDGWNLVIGDGENADCYVAIVVSGEHYNMTISEAPFVWNYDAALKTFQATINGVKVGLGTEMDKGHETLSAYNVTKYGTDNNFLAHLYSK